METAALKSFLLALAAAGCVAPAPPSAPDPARIVEDALALLSNTLVNGHDHTDPLEHAGAAWRLEQVFETNLPTDGVALSPPSEFVLHDRYAFVSLFHPSAGFVILNLADPERPVQVGRFDSGTAYVNDVEVSRDGRWAFLPTSPIETRENDPLDGGTPIAGDYGVQVVDVSDVSRPRLAALWVAPDPDRMGYHRLDLEEIGGRLYVFGASLGYPRIDILRFDETHHPRLTLVGVYLSDDAKDPTKNHASSPSGFGVHDVTVDPDPLDGFPLMAVSHWRSGAHFVDVRDPANPRFLGRWDGFPVEVGNVHNVEFTAIEDRRIAVAVPEYPVDAQHQGGVWVVDATDFRAPRLLGNWNLPGAHPSEGAPAATDNHVYSTNRVLLRQGLVFDAHFHAGVIVLDISTLEKAAQPELVAFLVPRGETRVPYATIGANPYIYDAIPRGDHLYFSDLTGGFHVARMDDSIVRMW